MKRKAVFLDRDGTLNRAIVRGGRPFPPSMLAELELLPGVTDAVGRLKAAGYVLIVVSNQPDVANGMTPLATVEAINARLAELLAIDRFIMCFHSAEDDCACRKPRPGMLLAGAREFNVNLAQSYMVGDRWRDVGAGVAAGCRTIFIDYSYAEQQPERSDYTVASLEEAAAIILDASTSD